VGPAAIVKVDEDREGRSAERRGRLDLADLGRIRELLVSLPVGVERVELGETLGDVIDIARNLQLSAFDAAYLALAVCRGLALATIDDRLQKACETAGVELVGRTP